MEQKQRGELPPIGSCPLVTIIISSYNYEPYVIQAIESALGQTYQNIEVVVTDDGSTDRSWDLIQSFAAEAQDPRLRIFHKQNEGPGLTTLFGVAQATGELIAFLASDDFFYPEKIARQLDLLHKSPPNVAMLHTGAYADYGGGEVVDMAGQYVPAEGCCLEAILALQQTAVASTIMLRRDAYLEVGGFDLTMFAEDIDLFAALAARGYEFRYDPAPLTQKRFRKGSLSSCVEPCFESHFRILDKYRDRLPQVRQREIEDKLYLRMGQAAASEGLIGLSFRTYTTLARRTRSFAPLLQFAATAGRHLAVRALPSFLVRVLRRKRAQRHVGAALPLAEAGPAGCR